MPLNPTVNSLLYSQEIRDLNRFFPIDPKTPFPRIDGYTLVEILGKGGMGIVFLAIDEAQTRRVAIKTIKPDHVTSAGLPLLIERFENEISRARRIQHDRMPIIHASGWFHPNPDSGLLPENRLPYFVMDFIPGPTVRDLLQRWRWLPPAFAVQIAMDVCEAMAVLHSNGLIHRDLKPENIKLNAAERYKTLLLDMGLVYDVNSATPRATLPGQFLGTPMYSAPERDSESVDASRSEAVLKVSDVYSLGVVLFEMLTGNLFKPIVHDETDVRNSLSPFCSEKLVLVVLDLLKIDHSKRIQNFELAKQRLKECSQEQFQIHDARQHNWPQLKSEVQERLRDLAQTLSPCSHVLFQEKEAILLGLLELLKMIASFREKLVELQLKLIDLARDCESEARSESPHLEVRLLGGTVVQIRDIANQGCSGFRRVFPEFSALGAVIGKFNDLATTMGKRGKELSFFGDKATAIQELEKLRESAYGWFSQTVRLERKLRLSQNHFAANLSFATSQRT